MFVCEIAHEILSDYNFLGCFDLTQFEAAAINEKVL